MLPQTAAQKLLTSLAIPAGGVSVWPWHEDDGRVTMVVVINASYPVDERKIPQQFEGYNVRVERKHPTLVRAAVAN